LIAAAPRPEEEPTTEWERAKGQIREKILEIAFLNWFDGTRQIQRCGTKLFVEVPDEPPVHSWKESTVSKRDPPFRASGLRRFATWCEMGQRRAELARPAELTVGL
jgi:hypothetical protein